MESNTPSTSTHTTTPAESKEVPPRLSPRERKGSFSVIEPPQLFKRTEIITKEVNADIPHHAKRDSVVTPDPPFLARRDVLTPDPPMRGASPSASRNSTPDLVNIPSSLLPPATESFTSWLPNRTFSLIYKATKDGFGKTDFHKTCDNKGPTITLILSDRGFLFGGYAPISWGRTFDGYDTHPDCFLFTITNPHSISPTQYRLRNGNSYALRNGQHVSFGWCGDLRIADDSAHLTSDSATNFPRSFIDTTGKGNATFTGEYKFKVVEIEVYLVM